VKRLFIFVLILLGTTGTPPLCAQRKGKLPQQREVKIQKTSLTKQQEEQLGKEAAAEVERTMEVVHNPAAEAWLNNIGQRLAKTPEANAYPYYFKLVNDQSINAFALPGAAQTGGSIFVVPQGGAAKSQTGGVELILGAMLDYCSAKSMPRGSKAGSRSGLNARVT
jgi:hypothetical protein